MDISTPYRRDLVPEIPTYSQKGHWTRDTPHLVDSQTPMKTLPSRNSLADGDKTCVKLASVSVWVSVWVIWRITNRHTFRILPILNSAYFTAWYDELRIGILLKYADLRIGSILKVCRFLIRHTLPHGMTIWRRHSVKYAELRIGIL